MPITFPSVRLRWVPKEKSSIQSEKNKHTCYGFIPETDWKERQLFVLQQFWSDGMGGGEWRDVEVDLIEK